MNWNPLVIATVFFSAGIAVALGMGGWLAVLLAIGSALVGVGMRPRS